MKGQRRVAQLPSAPRCEGSICSEPPMRLNPRIRRSRTSVIVAWAGRRKRSGLSLINSRVAPYFLVFGSSVGTKGGHIAASLPSLQGHARSRHRRSPGSAPLVLRNKTLFSPSLRPAKLILDPPTQKESQRLIVIPYFPRHHAAGGSISMRVCGRSCRSASATCPLKKPLLPASRESSNRPSVSMR